MSKKILLFGLTISVFISALEVVLHRHESRQLFLTLQDLHAQQSAIDREWGQLLLEQGTWGTHARIEDIARTKLNMTLPTAEKVFRVRS